MSDLSCWERWLVSSGPLRNRYWQWRMRRLERWAERNKDWLPPRPTLLDQEGPE